MALDVTQEGKHVLFLVRDPKAVTKRLAVAVSSPATTVTAAATAGGAAATAAMTTERAVKCLHQVHFRRCRSIYDLLRELDQVEQSWRVRAWCCS